MLRSCGSLAEMVASEYFLTSSSPGANIRAPANSMPVRVISRLRMPPVRDLCSEYGVTMTYASCWAIIQGVVEEGLAGSAAGAGTVAFPPNILNITVPQVGHFPLMALRPFFMVSSTPSMISFLALHLTQYPSGIEKIGCRGASCPAAVTAHSLGSGCHQRQQGKGSGDCELQPTINQ